MYEVRFENGLLHRRGPPGESAEWTRITTTADGLIFVLRDNTIYAHEKKTDEPPR